MPKPPPDVQDALGLDEDDLLRLLLQIKREALSPYNRVNQPISDNMAAMLIALGQIVGLADGVIQLVKKEVH